MKISKLFHWLYAVLMFLPLVMFLPSCLYYSLNKYATNETTTLINYKYQSNEVNTIDDLVEGNIYHLNIDNTTIDNYFDMINGHIFDFDVLYTYNYNLEEYAINLEEFLSNSNSGNPKINFHIEDAYLQIYIYLTDNDYFLHFSSENLLDENDFSMNFVIQLNSINGLFDFSIISYTDYNVIESVETNVQDTISNKMYQAWESIWNLPLFAWTKNSFVSAPFTYITGLFGLSSTNSLNYVFTYFCSISICWLVFDLLMYVPNLAHRWLDKGAIE